MKRMLGFMMIFLLTFSLPGYAKAATDDVDWKTAIETTDDYLLNKLFENEYENPKTLYTTTYLNMRPYPNTNSEVEKVLPINTKVETISEYRGWSKISYNDEYFYLWNEYLSTEKIVVTEEKSDSTLLGTFKLTAYCNCSICCGEWAGGPTTSGIMPVAGRTVAMYGIPLGTKLMINGHVYTVDDRGTPYGHIDIYHNSHGEALAFGVKYAEVYRID